MSRPLKCTAIGECMIELRDAAPGQLAKAYAGDTFNTLYYLNALLPAPASRCRFFSALGDDALSDAMREQWLRAGIDTSLVATRAGRLPGIYHISTDADGERRFSYWRAASAARDMLEGHDAHSLRTLLQDEDLLYLSGITLAILPPAHRAMLLDALAACRHAGLLIAFDDNYRPSLWEGVQAAVDAMGRAFGIADIALVSFPDQQALFGDQAPGDTVQRLRRGGLAEAVVRNGAGEGLLAPGDRIEPYRPPHLERAVDTTGAGDSFSAAYLAARLLGAAPGRAARAANRLASIVVMTPGALLPHARIPALADLLDG